MESLIEKFIRLEEENHLLSDEIDGFTYWPYLRFSIYMKLEEIANNQNREIAGESRPSGGDVLQIIKNCTIKNPLLYRQKKDILFISHARRVKIDGSYRCIYTDKIADAFADNSVSAEFIYGNKHMRPEYTKNILPLDYVDIWPALKFPIYKRSHTSTISKLNSKADYISTLIADSFGIKIEPQYVRSMLVRRFYWHKSKKKLMSKIIDQISPKVIVEVVGYEVNKLIINEIASEKGIETIELQHGVMGRGHLAYNYLVNRKYDFLPKTMFLFSDYWIKTCSFPLEQGHMVATGFPYQEEQMAKYPPMEHDKLTVLILSQPEFSDKLLPVVKEVLSDPAIREMGIQFIYKLHPAEYRVPLEHWEDIIAFENVDLIRDSNTPLYSLFAKSDIQIGVTSTAIFEGLAYNLKTLIYHIEKTDVYMGDLCNQGYAQFFDTKKELVEKIAEVVNAPATNNEQQFFKLDSMHVIQRELSMRCKEVEAE